MACAGLSFSLSLPRVLWEAPFVEKQGNGYRRYAGTKTAFLWYFTHYDAYFLSDQVERQGMFVHAHAATRLGIVREPAPSFDSNSGLGLKMFSTPFDR